VEAERSGSSWRVEEVCQMVMVYLWGAGEGLVYWLKYYRVDYSLVMSCFFPCSLDIAGASVR